MTTDKITFGDEKNEDLFRMGGAELRDVAAGRSKRATAAQAELERRAANRAAAAAEAA